MNEQSINIRDIHLPDPVSWWPVAPGWWILLVGVILIIAITLISRKIYQSKQLKRDIISELDHIKQQFKETQNKIQLAKSLSILLRRASISFYPATHIAGLTGEKWLAYLDKTTARSSADEKFQSKTGKVLLTAPYLPENAPLDYDAQALIRLSQSWLLSTHKKMAGVEQ